MQLILEADNSEINIKEKMTTVEDSIEKLMNGVSEIEKTSENGNLSNSDKENKLNGDNVVDSQNNMESGYKDVLDELPASRHNDISENKPPEKDSDKENCLNGNEVEDVLAPLCDEGSKNCSPGKEKLSHLETENSLNVDVTQCKENIGIEDKSLSEEVTVPISENFSEKEMLPTEKVSNLENEKCLISGIIESENQIETATKTVFKEAPALPSEKIFENESSKSNEESRETADKTMFKEATALPCGDVSENESTKSNNESLLTESTEIANKINSYEESRVDISEETEMSLHKYEEEKSEEGFKEQLDDKKDIADKQEEVNVYNLKSEDPKEILEEPGDDTNIADKQETVHEKILKSEDHEELSEQKITETKRLDDATKIAETTTALCKNMKDQNDIIMQVKEESSFSSLNVDKHDDYATVDTELEKSDCVQNQPQASGTDMKECNLEKDHQDQENILIPESENIPENTDTDVKTLVDPVSDSTELLNSESSDAVKQIDMECEEVISSVTEPNKSTSTAMDCDMDDLDLNKKDSTENLLGNVASDQITPQEDSELDKTNTLKNEATTERLEKVLKDINEANKIKEKDTSTLTESTVVEKMDTSEENVIAEIFKENEVPEITADKKKTSSELKDEKETVDKKISEPCVLTKSPCKDVNSDIEEVKVINIDQEEKSTETPVTSKLFEKPTPVVKLSNTLNILSDDEDELPKTQQIEAASSKPIDNKQCINIEDDDDVMVIEDTREAKPKSVTSESTEDKKDDLKSDSDAIDAKISEIIKETELSCTKAKESSEPQSKLDDLLKTTEKISQEPTAESKKEEPLLPKDLFKSYRKNLTEMTRDDLEEFCILKIVESIIDRSSLNEIKTKLKTMSQTIEEYKKKAMMLTKQNRDLQVVLKSIQEEQKKGGDSPIVPLKITRSVGMQVLMTDKNARRKVMPTPTPGPSPNVNNRPARNINQSPRQQPPVTATNQQIPVPRLVPAPNNPAANKTPNSSPAAATRNAVKTNSSIPNGVRNSPPAPKAAEKRGRSQSITVDLTDDEPPPKIPAAPVRVVPSQNLLTPRAQMTSNTLVNPRKVYIPIGSNHNPNVRPGQTIMLKNVPNTPGPRPRGAAPMVARGPTPNQIRMSRVQGRHPAPLPDAVKQYQPPNWKALPPAPDLKLSKVENGIVISWKIDGYQEDSYEEIASYQLYAYQETSSPPNTSLWKKIGDVKALPLPMACTLTQFMAGYKYYFAVRAVDIRSRLGPFSLPGSILLLNKM